ncbi:pleckstrin homology domain-containing protein pruning defect 1 isoform X2 [Lycorma delicatula]|uniref:pleckstrin homology domain-containing protein pruning defect 1 isoform X2 n=1 Tax=Lycorma delicatula TaxID=130591 RepID=UPI003F510C93
MNVIVIKSSAIYSYLIFFFHFIKGITWLCYTLVEGSLLSYISSLVLDIKVLHRYYQDIALLRDHDLVIRLISALHKLSSVILSPITDRMADELIPDEQHEVKHSSENCIDFERKNPDLSLFGEQSHDVQQAKRNDLLLSNSSVANDVFLQPDSHQNQPLPLLMTSSIISLASPVDSGVALIDSDFDNTSVSEATFDNDKNEDDLPFTNLEESAIIWGESVESQPDSVANRIITEIYTDNMSLEQATELSDSISKAMLLSNKEMRNCEDNMTSLNDRSDLINNDKNEIKKIINNDDNSGDEIVFRRTRGRKAKKEKSKCVSFHEDSNRSDYKDALLNKDNKRLSINDNLNWCIESEVECKNDDQIEKENLNNSNKENLLANDSLAVLTTDSEVGVEVDCGSSSSTVTEVSSCKKNGLYKKWNDVVKQRFESVHSKINKSEPEIFYGSTSSLYSNNNNNNNNNDCEVVGSGKRRPQQKSSIQKRHSIGHMLKSIKGHWLIPVSERGVPEGQEDPQKFSSSVSNLNEKCLYTTASSIDLSSDSEWSSDVDEHTGKRRSGSSFQSGHKSARRCLWPSRNLHEALSKTSLVNRFLKSIPESKVNVHLTLNRKREPLYIKGIKPDEELSRQLLDELKNEMMSNKREQLTYSVELDDNLYKAITLYTLKSPNEKIYKVYKVSSLDGLPLLCILSNCSLYVTGISPVNQAFFNHHIIPYSQLNTIIVGPNSQVMMLAVTDRSHRITVLTTLGQCMVNELVGHLELAVRRSLGISTITVQELLLENMAELKRMIIKQSSVQKDEELEHYVWVNVGDSSFIPASSPLGPTKSGHLMFRPHKHSSWLPGYVLLKAGVLYVFADANQRLPNHAVPLHSGQCCGCRRVPHPIRPHTFEIILPNPCDTFQLAAADEYEVSDWLQAFVQAASGDSDSEVIHDELSEAITGCGLLLTTNHVLTLNFPYKVLACAQLQYISSIKLAFNCCVLETGCREISEGGGDWVIYFATDLALEEFLSSLVKLQPSLAESIVMMSESDPLNIRCEQTSRLLEESWQLLLSPQIT